MEQSNPNSLIAILIIDLISPDKGTIVENYPSYIFKTSKKNENVGKLEFYQKKLFHYLQEQNITFKQYFPFKIRVREYMQKNLIYSKFMIA